MDAFGVSNVFAPNVDFSALDAGGVLSERAVEILSDAGCAAGLIELTASACGSTPIVVFHTLFAGV